MIPHPYNRNTAKESHFDSSCDSILHHIPVSNSGSHISTPTFTSPYIQDFRNGDRKFTGQNCQVSLKEKNTRIFVLKKHPYVRLLFCQFLYLDSPEVTQARDALHNAPPMILAKSTALSINTTQVVQPNFKLYKSITSSNSHDYTFQSQGAL